ncbi:MAG: hypothetical protein ACR2QM_13110 [Longimicrobiales bacterium]
MNQDYILRMIEQLGAALIQMRRAILGGSAAAGEVEQTLRRAAGGAGMDLDLARATTTEGLIAMIAPTGEVDPMRCWILAELFLTEGLDRSHHGDPDGATAALKKSAALFRLLGPEAVIAGYPEAAERLAEIERLLEEPTT